MKERYIKLFQEKAEECVRIRDELSRSEDHVKDRDRRIADLQYREEELQNLLSKTQTSIEEKYRGGSEEVLQEIQALKSHTGQYIYCLKYPESNCFKNSDYSTLSCFNCDVLCF